MEYDRKDYESYRGRYNRDDEDRRNLRERETYRNRNYAEEHLTPNREAQQNYTRDDRSDRGSRFSDRRDSESYQEQGYRMGYPDRYSAGQGYAQETYSGQGARRSHLRCRDIMTRQVTTCNKNTRIQEIARLMREEDIGAVPVLDEKGKLEGIVTDRDLIVKGLTADKAETELDAEDCMSTDLFTANMNDRLVDVLRDMGDNQVRRVPVVDNRERLVGIISMADVATQTSKDRELEETLKEISKPSSFFGRLAYYLGM
jgi:CBS domain-containing protein